jgi:hypothetical protein
MPEAGALLLSEEIPERLERLMAHPQPVIAAAASEALGQLTHVPQDSYSSNEPAFVYNP